MAAGHGIRLLHQALASGSGGGLWRRALAAGVPATLTPCIRLGISSDRNDIAAFYSELGVEFGPHAGGILPIIPLMGSLFIPLHPR
jgi:hypothetical protein